MFNASDSCGASSALQNLGKHVNSHPSAQNERIKGQQPVTNGFRSARGTTPSGLNESFHAFTNGATVPADHVVFDHRNMVSEQMLNHVNQVNNRPQLSDWSNEFSRLSLGGPSHDVQPQQSHSSWSNDFFRSLRGPSMHQSYGSGLNTAGPSMMQPTFAQSSIGTSQVQYQQELQEQQLKESFEKAFQQVEQYMTEDTQSTQNDLKGKANHRPDTVSLETTYLETSVETYLESASQAPTHPRPIESLPTPVEAIPEHIRPDLSLTRGEQSQDPAQAQDSAQPPQSSEDLSEVARGIVNIINNSTTQNQEVSNKLKNSNFMNLMERLSTKKVILQENKFLDMDGNDVGAVLGESKVRAQSGTTTPDIEAVYDTLRNNLNLSGEREQQFDKIMTPLEMAQRFMPGLPASAWEENWDEF